MSSVETTHYILGSVVGPHPFPVIVRDFQSVIGRETIEQSRAQIGRLPDLVVACVGGGSNSAGMFYPFVEHASVELLGVEAGGRSVEPGDHAAPLSFGSPGVLHGSYSYVMQDEDGQTSDVHSISAGLDYPGVGPEHSYWKESGRRDTRLPAMTKPWLPSTRWPAAKESCPRWKARTPLPKRSKKPAAGRRIKSSSHACRGVATRTRSKSLGCGANRSPKAETAPQPLFSVTHRSFDVRN